MVAPKTTPNADKSRFINTIQRLKFKHPNRYPLVIPITFKNRGKVINCIATKGGNFVWRYEKNI